MTEKQCTKCGVVREVEDFPKDSRLLSGLSSQCRGCHAIRSAKHYKANRKKSIARSRAWQLAHPERFAELQQKAYAKIPRISADEWASRKAATKQRSQINTRQAMSRRWHTDPSYRESRRVYMNNRRADERKIRASVELRADIEQIRTAGVKRKRSHHIICPLLRFYPELFTAAQQARQRLRDGRQDPEKKRAQTSHWKKMNPAKVSIQRYRRRVNFQNCVTDLTEDQWSQIKVVYKNRCGYCGERKPLTQDHIIPVSKGGDHTASNIIPACRSCNSRKHARLPLVSYQPHLIA